jgi:hypothetical protein
MSASLSLLDEVSKSTSDATKAMFGESTTAQTCTPAILILLVGALIVIYDIVNKNPERAGYRMTITFILAAIVLALCLLGLGDISWFIFLLPVVIILGFVVIVILTLVLTTPGSQMLGPGGLPPIEPEPSQPSQPSEPPSPDQDPCKDCKDKRRPYMDAYTYVMTGKGFLGMGFN